MANHLAKQARILVVDDDAEMQVTISHVLDHAGYDVVAVEAADEGFRVLCNQPIDLIILDMVMPGRNGVEATMQFVRSFPEIPILVVSGATTREYLLVAAERAGAAKGLPKPFHPDELIEAVRETLRFKQGDGTAS